MCVTIEHDGAEIKQGAEGYIQAAVLYTSANGQRLVRTINVAFPYSTALADVFRHSDMHALSATLARGAVAMMATKSVGDVQKHLTKSAVNTLHAYRRNYASNSAPGQLILPEALKYLPLLTLCILKSPVARANIGNRSLQAMLRADDRIEAFAHAMSSSAAFSFVLVSPFHTNSRGWEGVSIFAAASRPLSAEKLSATGAYLLFDGTQCYIYFGNQSNPATVDMIFGPGTGAVMSNADAAPSLELKQHTNPLSEFVVDAVRKLTGVVGDIPQPLVVVHKGKYHSAFMRKLVEDQFGAGDQSYVSYLCSIHKSIQRELQAAH